MFAKPKLKASFDVHTLNDNVLFLLSEHEPVIIESALYAKLGQLLDGEHSIAQIVKSMDGSYTMQQIFFAINRLEQRGYITEGENATPHFGTEFIEYLGGDVAGFAENKKRIEVAVRSFGNSVSSKSMIDALEQNELRIAETGSFLVVVTDEYLRPELKAINKEALAQNRPWMLVKPIGMTIWVGPIFVPGETGCWHCLAQRQQTNQQVQSYIQKNQKLTEPIVTSVCHLPATVNLGYNLAALEITKYFIASDVASTKGRIVTFDLNTRLSQEHILVRRPQCPACGDEAHRHTAAAAPPRLISRKKRFCKDGGHRTHTPEQTLEKYKHHISPILGIVTELTPVFDLGGQLAHSYVAGHNFAMGIYNIVFLRESLRGMSGGKGASKMQAKTSGLCEAIERYSCNYDGDEYAIRGTYNQLQPKALHPNACMGFSEEQFQNREESNAANKDAMRLMVPNPFDPDREISWTPIWSLSNQEQRYLPTALCFYGHPEFGPPMFLPDSNGSAAGNTIEEAILQGFMELVERDAVALWWYNRIKRPEVDLDSFGMPYLDAIREFYTTLNRDIWVLDITSDLDITTFAGVSKCHDRVTEDIILGFGAHFDPKIALLRAITEVNQFLPTLLFTNPDGSTRYLFGDVQGIDWWTTAVLAENDYLLPDKGLPPVRFSDKHDPSSDDLLTDIHTCVEIAQQHQMDIYVMDQTRPDIGLSVVKVIVPELCHFWRRLGKPRLSQVPVKMGWVDEPISTEQLNPYSIFF